MAIWNLYSKRERAKRDSGRHDPLVYDDLPNQLRVQIVQVLQDAIGAPEYHEGGYYGTTHENQAWASVHDIIAREYGLFRLGPGHVDKAVNFLNYLLKAETGCALDMIELAFRAVERLNTEWSERIRRAFGIRVSCSDAIDELNGRFREHHVGYSYHSGCLMRTESEVLHAEVAVPALQLLHDARFSGPAEEFLDAHRKYLAGDNKDAVQAALKAFESTMKSICDDRSWKYSDRATAKELIGILMREGLIPPMLQTQFASLEQLLASGLPTLRNRTKGVGHGQGKARQTVENHLVAYSLHIAGSNIVVAFHGSWREVRGLVSASLARN